MSTRSGIVLGSNLRRREKVAELSEGSRAPIQLELKVPLKLKHRLTNSARVLTYGAWQVWVTVLVLAMLLAAPGLWTCTGEAGFRHAGLLLQLAGLGLVAIGIHETRRRFGRPSLFDSLRAWITNLKNALFLPRVTGSGHPATVLAGTGEMKLTGFAPMVTTSLEGRLTAVEAEVQNVGRRLSQFINDSTLDAADLRRAIAEEITSRERTEGEIRSLIEDEAAGGLHLETMGLVWLLVGTVAGALASELAHVLPNYPCLSW
jgi:hypothetical protein